MQCAFGISVDVMRLAKHHRIDQDNMSYQKMARSWCNDRSVCWVALNSEVEFRIGNSIHS